MTARVELLVRMLRVSGVSRVGGVRGVSRVGGVRVARVEQARLGQPVERQGARESGRSCSGRRREARALRAGQRESRLLLRALKVARGAPGRAGRGGGGGGGGARLVRLAAETLRLDGRAVELAALSVRLLLLLLVAA